MFYPLLAAFPLLVVVLGLLGPVSSQIDAFLQPNVDNADSSPSLSPRILLLTAHPDDECFFFAPTVLSLLASHDRDARTPEVFSLCLSTGNADGMGERRRGELSRSLDVLGIDQEKRWVVDHPELQDNITMQWNAEVIAETITPYILENRITTILTFDGKGISLHPNHFSLPFGVSHLISSWSFMPDSTLPRPRLFTLITVPVLTKYSGIISALLARLDILLQQSLTYLLVPSTTISTPEPPIASSISKTQAQALAPTMPVFISGTSEFFITARAIKTHNSQLVWFRYLYMIFSRYMWVNEWVEVRS
ncbi:hypothetical protein SERLA73DRAFT_175559 [Serpula lacrymans var. lacrymans S7.3]|uniref:N-acetylglucosaminylphosphatidylinositol deacetylase n=2 Tax=Serpula lacrymans var. lacrymans TaxID=341189 RepID=F8PKF5_SERL3|nr:uncharacterized protein SERLADRAFT_458076 [Serpula lacrymans var. lacrymans S7.9]EGO03869.1 hypothetical protein SERLA73DRAFT_175559 [Serpula lacrymans var. lacrymans S7.3]EGO29796.1 hypothetical protein SERLADRAFT_458076 [Serpula lacrymans var. lacrymans S7.9]